MHITRRAALRRLTAGLIATAGAGKALSRLAGPGLFENGGEETYRGRRIRINRLAAVHPGLPLPMDIVTVDGMALHIMINADATFTPLTHHYRTFPTLRAASRAAVDSLGTASLLPVHIH